MTRRLIDYRRPPRRRKNRRRKILGRGKKDTERTRNQNEESVLMEKLKAQGVDVSSITDDVIADGQKFWDAVEKLQKT